MRFSHISISKLNKFDCRGFKKLSTEFFRHFAVTTNLNLENVHKQSGHFDLESRLMVFKKMDLNKEETCGRKGRTVATKPFLWPSLWCNGDINMYSL